MGPNKYLQIEEPADESMCESLEWNSQKLLSASSKSNSSEDSASIDLDSVQCGVFCNAVESSGNVEFSENVESSGSAPEHWDDLSGKPLNPELVKRARLEEMGELAKHRVYEKVPISECWNKTGSGPIGTRWVDVNKGDDSKPDYRSRLVAKELNTNKREDPM